MSYERERHMREQEATEAMIRMRTPLPQRSPHPDPRDEIIADLVEALSAIVESTSVGKHGHAVSTKSRYANYPATFWYKAKAALEKARQA